MEGLSPFRRLQDGQSACPLMESVAPPRDQGVMWSPCQPGSSSVPQLEQRPPEARYIATRSAVLKRRRVERLTSPREGGVESATSATPHWLSGHSPGSCGSAGLLCVLCGGRGGYFTPPWRLARYHTRVGSVYPEVGFWWAGWFSPKCSSGAATYCCLRIERDGLTPRLKPGSAPKNFDQRTLLCGESTPPTPHHPLQRLPSHPLMPQPRRRLPTQLSQNSYRLTIPPHPRIRLRHIQAMPVPRVRRGQPRLRRQPTSHLQHPVRPIRNQLRLDTSQLHGERTERPPAPQLVVAVTPDPSRSHARQPERLSRHIRPVVAGRRSRDPQQQVSPR